MQLDELKGVIYTRKSTISDGKSTRDQERECRNWCETNNIQVDTVFCDEGKSASRYGKKPRDAWTDLKNYLRSGHVLVAWEASRASRDVGEWAALRNLCAEHGVPFAYSGRVLDMTSGDDRFVGGLDALLAERESEQIRERVNRGLRGTAADGTPYSRVPWGYRLKPRVSGRRPEWEPHPLESLRVREAVSRILAGESYLSVLRWLKLTGYAPANPSHLRRSLVNPALAGKRVYQGRVVGEAKWPAILTEDTQSRLAARSKDMTVTPGPEPKHLCSGTAVCGKCGEGLRHKVYPDRKPLYVCRHGHVSRLADMLDAKVEEAVLRRLRSINPSDYNSEDPRVAESLDQIHDLEVDLKEWEAKAIAGEVSAAVFSKVEKDRNQKIADLRPHTVPDERTVLIPENWDTATMREKRNFLKAWFRITVPPLGRRKATPDDVDIVPI